MQESIYRLCKSLCIDCVSHSRNPKVKLPCLTYEPPREARYSNLKAGHGPSTCNIRICTVMCTIFKQAAANDVRRVYKCNFLQL